MQSPLSLFIHYLLCIPNLKNKDYDMHGHHSVQSRALCRNELIIYYLTLPSLVDDLKIGFSKPSRIPSKITYWLKNLR